MADFHIPEGISLAGHFSKNDKDFVSVSDMLKRPNQGGLGFRSVATGNDVEPREQQDFTPSADYIEALQKEAEGFAKAGLAYVPPPDMRPRTTQRQPSPIKAAMAAGPLPPAVTENEEDDDLFDWTGESPQPKQALYNPHGQAMPPSAGVREEDIESPDAWGAIERQVSKTGPIKAQKGQAAVESGERRQEMSAHQHQMEAKAQTNQGAGVRTQGMHGIPGVTPPLRKPMVSTRVFDQIQKVAQDVLGMNFSAYQGVNPMSDPDIDPIFLDMVLIKSFGKDWLNWDPETIRAEYGYVFRISPSRRLMDKTLAVQTVHASEKPFTEWNVFAHTAAALTNHDVRFGDMPELSPAEAAYAAVTMQRIRRSNFSPEVISFWAGLCLNEHLIVPPIALSQALPIMEKRIGRTHPELLPEMRKVQEFMKKNWAPTGEDNLVDEQIRRLRAMEAYTWFRLSGRPQQ